MPDPAEIEMMRQILAQEAMAPQRMPRPGDLGLSAPRPPYPLQPNGRPDLSGVPFFGEQGFAELARKVGPDMAMDLFGIAAPVAAGPVIGALGRATGPVGEAIGALASRFPKTAAATEGAAVGGAMHGADNLLAEALAAGGPKPISGEDADRVMQLQRELKASGYYKGPIDGRMEGGTSAAKKAFDAAQQTKGQQDIERQRAEAETARAAAEGSRAQAEAQKIVADQEAARRSATQREQGNTRFQQMENDVPWYRQALRDYGPTAGMVLGGALGGLTRYGVVKGSDKLAGRAASRADELMTGRPPDAPIADRVARVNQFYSEGGGPQPFVPAPGTPRGFSANPDAGAAANLYQPNRGANALTDIGIPLGFGAGALATTKFLGEPAKKELSDAQQAASQDPSEINLRRLQTAKDNAALADALYQGERSGGIGYGITAIKMRRHPDRPNVSSAESERFAIDRELAAPPALPPGPQAPPPAPPRPDGRPNLKTGYEYRSDGIVYDQKTGHPVAKKYLPLVKD